MLKRNQLKRTDDTAQSLAEYLMMMGAVLAVIVVFTRPGGMFTTSVNRAVELTIATMNVTATDVFNDIGTVN